MAKNVMLISQMDDWDRETCAVKNAPLLTAGELFTIRILPENKCFDSPEQTCIQTEWAGIADIAGILLGNSIACIDCFADVEVGISYELDCVFVESGASSSFLLDMYAFGIGQFETPLPKIFDMQLQLACLTR
jgi:hypothetical protein